MALPMLVGGADCGPSNPLQGLSKQFDKDRGLQQDHFGPGRAGPSRETFRTQQPQSELNKDALRFFANGASPSPQLQNVPGASALDLSSLYGALPGPATRGQTPVNPNAQQMQKPTAAWAADFVMQQPQVQAPQMNGVQQDEQVHARQGMMSPVQQQQQPGLAMGGNASFRPAYGMQMNNMSMDVQPYRHPSPLHAEQHVWDREFQAREIPTTQQPEPASQQQQPAAEQDDLARTAGLLVDSLKHEQNPKFAKSAFMGLMRQLRDGEMVVDGNDMVANANAVAGASASGWASDFASQGQDVKGKGKAVEPPASVPVQRSSHLVHQYMPPDTAAQRASQPDAHMQAEDDENAAYFRQENAEFAEYWSASRDAQAPRAGMAPPAERWDRLQDDWDAFEATASGVRPVGRYEFQANNTYVLGELSRIAMSRHHAVHAGGAQSSYETVLELEAAVQCDPSNAQAWFNLGVKQQENEREHKAVQALRRSVALDPAHLPAYLALAISYTNDGDRAGTLYAIGEWVRRNEAYAEFTRGWGSFEEGTLAERMERLTECLIGIVGRGGDAIDADIQIALAVLLNTSEDYAKAQDCFRTALAVRPDDWLLYNRVGATMANSGHAEDALDYYYRALELNPAYIRARFNLGISCVNLRRYEEAAQHILDALVLQDSDSAASGRGAGDRGVTSTALWDSLKTTCLHMHRPDLAALCEGHDLERFRSAFQP